MATKIKTNTSPPAVHRTGFTGDTCDATGVRDYIYDLSGRVVSEVNSNTTECNDEIYAGSRHVGSTRGNIIFSHTDWLGTERVRIKAANVSNRSLDEHCQSLPFGDNLGPCTAGSYSSPLHFTGKERDSESGLDNSQARYMGSSLGRFMSPDPSNLSVDFWLPQSWNRYSYALNSPLAFVDQNGMWPTNIHNPIINEAFPGLSKDQLKTLQKASHDTDYKNQVDGHSPQDVEVSFVHGMSDGEHQQDPMQAQQEGDAFIAKNEKAAEQTQADWIASGQSGVAPSALTAFGNALHTVEDRTSPAHEGNQPWYGSWHWSAVQHVWAEHSINQNQMNNSVAAARYAYFRTFGLDLYLLAIRAHGACVTTTDSASGTSSTTCQ